MSIVSVSQHELQSLDARMIQNYKLETPSVVTHEWSEIMAIRVVVCELATVLGTYNTPDTVTDRTR